MTGAIAPVVVPADVDAADARDFIDLVGVANDAAHHDLGLDHLREEPAELLPRWQDETYQWHRGFLARDGDGCPIAALRLVAPKESDAVELEVDLAVLPAARGTAIETDLLAVAEAQARELGRTALHAYTLHPIDSPHPRLPSPTGFGAVPPDDRTQLFRDAGFELQQVERNSVFALSDDLDHVRDMRDAALADAGPEYRVLTWSVPTPPELRDSFAHVLSRMSTDVPAGGLAVTEEVWDAARVGARDERIAAAGLTLSVAAVCHVPSGRIVAYSDLAVGADRSRPTAQWGTLVTREHRGHRLGTIVKCENILRWRRLVPESPFISTFNAEENRPMLDVNEAIGFRPVSVAGAWQRRLS